MAKQKQNDGKKSNKVLWIVIALVVLFALTKACGGSDDSGNSSLSESETVAEISTVETTVEISTAEVSTETTTVETTMEAPTVETTVEMSTAEVSEHFFLDAANFPDYPTGEIDTKDLKLEYGDLLSVNHGGDGVFVVKAKISPSYSNKSTIDQNYFTVCDLIKNWGFDSCTELQYWAVADMTDGTEGKVISFTLDSTIIQGVYNGNIVENRLGDYVSDLWILPSLQN